MFLVNVSNEVVSITVNLMLRHTCLVYMFSFFVIIPSILTYTRYDFILAYYICKQKHELIKVFKKS